MSTTISKWLLGAAVALLVLSGCQKEEEKGVYTDTISAEETSGETPDAAQLEETERLNAWFDERYEEMLQFSPTMLTFLGRKDRYDEIDEFTEEAIRERAAWRVQTVEDMRANFDYDALTEAGKESWDLWVFETEQEVAGLDFIYQGYVFGELGGPEDQVVTFLINFHRVDTEEDLQAYITRVAAIGRAMEQVTAMAVTAAEMGVLPPAFAFETAIQRANNVITGLPFNGETDSPLLVDAKRKIGALVEAEVIDQAAADAYLEAVNEALMSAFLPAYAAYVAWLEAELPNADVEAQGVSALPNGVAYYNHQLETYTTLGMTADEVHQLGLDEVARIKGEMEVIKDEVGFEGDLLEFFAFIRTDPQFYFSNTEEGREGYLAETQEYLAEIEAKLPEYFGRLPKAGLEVKRVEEFREVDGGAQHYMPGTPDGSRNGVYYIHMSDMSSYSKTDMETVAYHEASPGHHMQISIAQELTDVPMFRTQANFSVYSEGWALYAEKLAKEMGQFKDPYHDFGRLTAEMWRAIRLVVDTGLHAKGWTQEQAEQFFFDNSAIPEGAVRSEVRRYLTIPGQATSYKIGMLKIEELRANAEAELGEQFDIRSFHDVVLDGGALPMPLLEMRVNNWIASQKS